MFDISINNILGREKYINYMIDKLKVIEKNINNPKQIRGFFIYGKNSVGKTQLVNDFIKKINYCKINYDGFDIRNKNTIENMQKINVSSYNILSMFQKKLKKNIIVMDDIEIMNIGDKGGINTLVKMLRPKKTKKQLMEIQTTHPIICICNEKHDKKLNELRKACYEIHIEEPNNYQIQEILKLYNIDLHIFSNKNRENIYKFINGNLCKLFEFTELYNWDNDKSFEIIKNNIKHTEKERIKELTKDIYINKYSIEDYSLKINETDKTSLSLLLHENLILILNYIISNIKKYKLENKDIINIFNEYNVVIKKYSFIDYYDRIIFQKQIWILNDLTALLKVKYINYFIQNIIHKYLINNKNNYINFINNEEIIFTKVLTKYTSEYNNKLFLNNISKNLNLDKKDTLFLFLQIFRIYNKLYNTKNIDKLIDIILDNKKIYFYNLSKLDFKRIYKFLEYLYNLN